MALAIENINEQKMARMALSISFAVFAHLMIFFILLHTSFQKTISSELLSLPTNVSIRFIAPQKQVQPKQVQKPVTAEPKIVKKAAVKPIEKKIETKQKAPPSQKLNKVEPAAGTPDMLQETVKPVLQKTVNKAIPVVSERVLKGRRVAPQYPERALRMKQEGVVWLHVLISETGQREEIKIHKPTKYALLNQAALKAVKKWTFNPNIVNGRATKSWVEIPVEFKIK